MTDIIPHPLDATMITLRDAKEKSIAAADYPLACHIRDLIQKYDPRCSKCGQVKPKWVKT